MSRRREAETSRRRQDRFRRPFVKRSGFHGPERLSSTSCPLGVRFRDRLERGPATVPRTLPPATGFRRSFALRSEEEGLDPAAFASSSPASARCHAPLVDFCNRNDPQARPWIDGTRSAISHPPLARRARTRKNGSPVPFGATKPRSHGSGAVVDRRLAPSIPSSSRRACARRELCPNPIGSDTSCRGPVVWPAGVAGSTRSDPPGDTPLSRCLAPKARFRFAFGRAASRTIPRRRMRSAAPEVPSFVEAPLRGGPFVSPGCPQPVDSGPGASAIPARSLPST
jgi:hypothetical protein